MTPAVLHEAMHALLREVTAKVITPRYQKLATHEITSKLADDVVTIADHESEAKLAEGLAKIVDTVQRRTGRGSSFPFSVIGFLSRTISIVNSAPLSRRWVRRERSAAESTVVPSIAVITSPALRPAFRPAFRSAPECRWQIATASASDAS